MNEDQKRLYALRAADELVERIRAWNKQREVETGYPSTVTAADYQRARDEIEAALLRAAGLARG